MDKKETILQIKNQQYVKELLGKEPWVQVSGNRSINGADAGFWCGLVSVDHIDDVYREIDWDISSHRQGAPGFEGSGSDYMYRANLLDDGFESIIFYRDFYGVKPDYVELSQEFVLMNNLRYDSVSNSYWAMYDNGEMEEAVKYIDSTAVQIKMKFLRNYAAAKQMALLLFFDIRTNYKEKASDFGIEPFNDEYKAEGIYYGLWGCDSRIINHAYSVLMGKKIIMPAPIETCGYWPYEREKTYEEFIIGINEFGNEIRHTCNPDELANYFGANPGAPHYLTPVFFKKEVLQKYLNKPELYGVRDGYLSCKSLWGIEIDNHYKNCVSVYLGDLGRDLPESEQGYWKSFNIVGEEELSEVAIKRDFLGMSAPSNMEDHKFQYAYSDLTRKWNDKFGWDLFLPLSEEDQYNLTQIHIPLGDSQPEFDQLVLSLVKVLIDSLNEKQLKLPSAQPEQRGIGKLEHWLQANGAIGYEEHISFLRDLQELRSTGSGHRKGKTYNKIAERFGLSEKRKMDVFEDILKQANAFLNYMTIHFLN